MIFTETNLKGAFTIEIKKIGDERGFFGRSWCRNEMEEHGLNSSIVQINTSLSKFKGTLRGLHFQIAPYQECKMIRCTRGAIFDMIVDLRPDSPTFLQWHGEELTVDNHKALYSPEGFAQGFITLTDDAEITYFTTQFYAPGTDRGIRYNDPQIGIKLPLEPVVISDKDRTWPDFTPDILK
ncbi:MAG TPA: dTDP-4-dehydrorhamnose 3,5-epimerase [Bacteroidales bacterium]|jgi:dTDP-4-dehydrorhamnose 3,5-epimerase|nr:dTDP-4-dehydrorhamnose 3,5-epimerase [Bacteroidales bacterium]